VWQIAGASLAQQEAIIFFLLIFENLPYWHASLQNQPIFTPLECLPHPKSAYVPFNIAFGNAPSLIGYKSQRAFRFKHVIFGNIIIMSIIVYVSSIVVYVGK
jgi:hypothetical protein